MGASILVIVVVLLPAAGLSGCGAASGSSNGTVARIGSAAIERYEVGHWASAIKRGNSVGTVLGHGTGTPRERALEFLISSRWIIGEAEAQMLSVSNLAVERGLREKVDAEPNGRPEFEEELSSTGQTLADARLEIESALAAAALRNAVAKRVPAVTGAEVTEYYALHRSSFYIPDRRVVYLIEELPSRAHAVALGKRLGPGGRFTRRASREVVPRETPAEVATRLNGRLVHMIFAATPGRVAGPAIFNGGWVLGVVKKLIPAETRPLGAVREQIAKTLTVQHRERAWKRFAAAFVRKWTAKTSCSPGNVVRGCSEYHGKPVEGGGPLS